MGQQVAQSFDGEDRPSIKTFASANSVRRVGIAKMVRIVDCTTSPWIHQYPGASASATDGD